MSYLARKIGIFYKDSAWAEEMFQEILNHIPKEAIAQVINSRHSKRIILTTGTIIYFIFANEHARGYRLHEVYLQEGINKTVYTEIILPHMTLNNNKAYMLTEAFDLYRPSMTADYYYWKI